MNELMTSELYGLLESYPLYSQDGKGEDAICLFAFCIGRAKWYVLEGDIQENMDITFFGIVTGLCETEYGYFSLKELQDVEVKILGIPTNVSVLKGIRSIPLKDIRDEELQTFLSNMK